MTKRRYIKFVVAGQIRNEFIIDVNGKTLPNQQGGSLLYAAASVNHWGDRVGLVGVVDRNYPRQLLQRLEKFNFDIRGIKIADEEFELRSFLAYPDSHTCICDNPVAVFAANNLSYPKELLGYVFDQDEPLRLKFALYSRILLESIPDDYHDAVGAHICPLDATCQIKLATMLQKGAVRTLTLQPHKSTMVPERIGEVAVLAKDTSAIIVHEMELRNLFLSRTDDVWEMMDSVCSFGCNVVIVKNKHNGYCVFDAYSKAKFLVPDYPARTIDPTGEVDVFCGAFLAEYLETQNSLAAAIQGSAAASIKNEGSGPFSIDSSLPGLDLARMEHIRSRVVKI